MIKNSLISRSKRATEFTTKIKNIKKNSHMKRRIRLDGIIKLHQTRWKIILQRENQGFFKENPKIIPNQCISAFHFSADGIIKLYSDVNAQ